MYALDSTGTDMIAKTAMADLMFPPSLLGDVFSILGLERVVFWLNAGEKFSKLHFDAHDALLTQIADGPKEVIMVSPFDSHKLYADFPRSELTHKLDFRQVVRRCGGGGG